MQALQRGPRQSSDPEGSGPRALLFALAGILCLALSARWGVSSHFQPPKALGLEAPEAEFSAARAMKHLEVVAHEPHPVGTRAHRAVREYLEEQLREAGLEPQVQSALILKELLPGRISAVRVANVLARLEGEQRGRALLLAAHYDSVPWGPGAGDNGAAVAALLETLRALRAGPQLPNDVIFLFTDGEEAPLYGAQAFVNEHPWVSDVALVLNFEARGAGGASIMFRTSPGGGALVREFSRVSPRPTATSISQAIFERLENDTDFSVFQRAGLAGMEMAMIGDASVYHTAADTPDRLSLDSLQHHGSHALALARHFGTQPGTPAAPSRAVYFNPFGRGLSIYSVGIAKGLALFAALLWCVAVFVAARRRQARAGKILGGFVVAAVAAPLGGGVAAVAIGQILRLDEDFRWLPLGFTPEGGAYTWGLLALAASAAVAMVLLARGALGPYGLGLGAALLWVGLALLAAFGAPGFSYLPTWPVLAALTAWIMVWLISPAADGVSGKGAALREAPATWLRFALVALGAVPAILLTLPVAILLAEVSGVRLPLAGAIALALLPIGLLAPLLDLMTRRWALWLPAACLTAALGLLLPAVASRCLGPENPRQDSLFYGLDTASGEAYWGSLDRSPDGWTGRYLGESTTRSPLRRFSWFWPPEGFLTAPAPRVEGLEPPGVDLVHQERRDDGSYLMTVRLRSPRRAPSLYLAIESLASVLEMSVDGRKWDFSQRPAGGGGEPAWLLSYRGPAGDGLEVSLKLNGWHPVEFHLVDSEPGLPDFVEPRPEDLIPRPGLWWEGTTLVRNTFSY